MAKHDCSRDAACFLAHHHMWFYGGWVLQRADQKSQVRIWKGKIREVRP